MRNYRIRILPRAVADLDSIIGWIYDQSPRGAAALLVAFEKAQTGLKRSPEAYSIAPESDLLGVELRQAFFKTRKGNTYRMIVKLNPDEVQILRIRGQGQPALTPNELNPRQESEE